MKKTYTKRQITEAIAYWKKQLKRLVESMTSDYVLELDGKTYNLIDGETDDINVDVVQSPYVQIYANPDDTVECVVYSETAPGESFAFTVEGLSGADVRRKGLHRTQMEVRPAGY